MVKFSKRVQQIQKLSSRQTTVPLKDAIGKVAQFPKVKFDETIELHFHLNLDVKNSDQGVRGTVALPHGTGRKIRVAVFCKGEQSQKAKDAGADIVGSNELIDQVLKGFMDFDSVVATPEMMRDLSKLGKVLGPRGLMPSPKAGTVTNDVEKTIKELKAGRIEFKSDKQAGIHVGIGKRSFSESQILENANTVIDAINLAKPGAVKGNLIKSLYLATSMGEGVKVTL